MDWIYPNSSKPFFGANKYCNIKDGDEMLYDITKLTIPPNSLLFVTNTNSMYNNIDTVHAIEVITWWLHNLHAKDKLPQGFPLNAVISAMRTIMENNIFKFGNLYFLQLLVTVIGTSIAVMWATLYFTYHKVHTILTNHHQHLLYFKRCINNMLGICTGNITTEYKAYAIDLDNFGVLTWDVTQISPSTSVNFLDMTIIIKNDCIVTKKLPKEDEPSPVHPLTSQHPHDAPEAPSLAFSNNTTNRTPIKNALLILRPALSSHPRSWMR